MWCISSLRKSAPPSCNLKPTRNANSLSSSSGSAAAAIRICRTTISRKSTTGASPMPTSILLPASRDGKRTGRIYIIWGAPDEIESHPTGGTYDRPMEEGGGSTTTYPWERWRYRYLEGIQENVELEFVDPSGSGEYHLTMDPSEKDALLYVPGAGLSLMESMGLASKTDRFTRSDGTHLPTSLGGTPASLNEFTRLELYAKVQRPPEVKYKDLEAIVTSRMVRDSLRFQYRTDFLKVTSDTVLVPISVQIPNNQLSFKAKDGVHSAELNIFGRVSTLTDKVVQ